MEIFGIGPLELLLILIIALIVFGPDRLPQIGARLGRAMREMRQATRQFSEEIEAAREAIEGPIKETEESLGELAKPLEEVRDAASTLSKAVTNPNELIRQSVLKELGSTAQEERADTTSAPAVAAEGPEPTIGDEAGPSPVQESPSLLEGAAIQAAEETGAISAGDVTPPPPDVAQAAPSSEAQASDAETSPVSEPIISYRAVAIEAADQAAAEPMPPEARMVAELAALAAAQRPDAATDEPGEE